MTRTYSGGRSFWIRSNLVPLAMYLCSKTFKHAPFLCRRRLGDLTSLYKFSDDQINQWINDAIAEYSIHFPLRKPTTITCAEDDREYSISVTGIQSIISVEYPTGEDPPIYLKPRPYTHKDFWSKDGYYEFIQEGDGTSQIWI